MDQQLLIFVTVAERQNFSRAAEELHMTQPSVSQYVQALERSLGTRLLDRNNKYVRLTKAGEIVYHHAKEILHLSARMRNMVDELINVPSGELSIGASYTFGEYVLPHAIARLRETYPLIKPSIIIHNTTEIVELVVKRELDVGIVEGDYRHEKAVFEPFGDDQMYLIVSANHRLAQKPNLSAGDLQGETWIVREKGSGTREATEKMFASLSLSPAHIMEFGSNQIIKESVEAGLGISFLSYYAIRKELLLGTLHLLPYPGIPITRTFSLVTQANALQTKALAVFLDLLRSMDRLT
ncbi:LysR family transcriptional regulator [Brevibacillus fulvus]|uniref:DNA-binding transcriptional LysR family regulator n=1 Tax=Brevibacillus fulvus TaxID=1125967 RepID=A0A939BW58_9BACL|nr:LysR family transcriptional regulator [Brevibacillus fulvus]MBM7592099.1 DNA-binding transcriptional LysR family regulator [Brevibacillus fulvus]